MTVSSISLVLKSDTRLNSFHLKHPQTPPNAPTLTSHFALSFMSIHPSPSSSPLPSLPPSLPTPPVPILTFLLCVYLLSFSLLCFLSSASSLFSASFVLRIILFLYSSGHFLSSVTSWSVPTFLPFYHTSTPLLSFLSGSILPFSPFQYLAPLTNFSPYSFPKMTVL